MKKILLIAAVVVLIALVICLAVYFWPTRSKSLQSSSSTTYSYHQAVARITDELPKEENRGVTKNCNSILMTHGKKVEKAVILLHGITACPEQFSALGKVFFDRGYNVYIPVTPHHGTADKKAYSNVRSSELVSFANDSATVASGLGDEVGVAGLSGGGLLSTWLAEYRSDVIKRLLLLSPFYEPAPSQAPKWQLPLLKNLYGSHILPDAYSDPSNIENPGFSYWALANYMIVEDNFKTKPKNLSLKSIGVVTAEDDDVIDHALATANPTLIATSNNLGLQQHVIPASWKAGHDIVSPDSAGVAAHQQALFSLYIDTYEGKVTTLAQ